MNKSSKTSFQFPSQYTKSWFSSSFSGWCFHFLLARSVFVGMVSTNTLDKFSNFFCLFLWRDNLVSLCESWLRVRLPIWKPYVSSVPEWEILMQQSSIRYSDLFPCVFSRFESWCLSSQWITKKCFRLFVYEKKTSFDWTDYGGPRRKFVS